MPDLATGDNILVHAPDGASSYATLAEVKSDQWCAGRRIGGGPCSSGCCCSWKGRTSSIRQTVHRGASFLLYRPPLYVVRAADGKYSTVTIDRIEAVGTSPTAPAAPQGAAESDSDAPTDAEPRASHQETPSRHPAAPAPPSGPPPPPQAPARPSPSPQAPHRATAPSPPPRATPSASPALRPIASAPTPRPLSSAPRPNGNAAAASGFEPSLVAITEAQKLAKTAASALSFEDVRTAVKYLNDALRLLTQPN